jgi:hypothetical protein
LEDYATGNFNLISEDDVEKQTIDDFSDDEIMEEVRSRKIFGNNQSIISEKTSLDSQNNRERESNTLRQCSYRV